MIKLKNIPRKIHHVNRCIFVFGEPLSGHQTEITETFLRPEVIQQLRDADHIVNKLLLDNELINKIFSAKHFCIHFFFLFILSLNLDIYQSQFLFNGGIIWT